MEAFIQKAPQAAMIIGDLYAKSLDWPGAEEIAERLKRMVPPQALGEGEAGPAAPDAPAQAPAAAVPPEVRQQVEQGMQVIQAQQARIAELEQAAQSKAAELQLRQGELALKARAIQVDEYRAETERMKAGMPPA